MKELIEGLLLVALLKFLGVPPWLVGLGCVLFLIGVFVDISMQSAASSRRKARDQQAEEIKEAERKEAERARQEAIADVEWNARFV